MNMILNCLPPKILDDTTLFSVVTSLDCIIVEKMTKDKLMAIVVRCTSDSSQ